MSINSHPNKQNDAVEGAYDISEAAIRVPNEINNLFLCKLQRSTELQQVTEPITAERVVEKNNLDIKK